MGFVMWQSTATKAMTDIVGMTKPMPMDIDKQWHVKKEIPISTVAMFAIQLGAFIWMIATLQTRVDQAEQKIAAYAPSVERIIKLEARLENVQDGIAEIKGILRNTATTSKRSDAIR